MSESTKVHKRILVVEDSNTKWDSIHRVCLSECPEPISVVRAKTMEEAHEKIDEEDWDLILLDISMDIRSSSANNQAGGHDTIGGLKIAERMFLLGFDIPTIIVTAYDAFPATTVGDGVILGLDDVAKTASEYLKSSYVGSVRYSDEDWEGQLATQLRKVIVS